MIDEPAKGTRHEYARQTATEIAAMSAMRTLALVLCTSAALAARPVPANAQTPLVAMQTVVPPSVIPSHLASGGQLFEETVTGLRAYIESIKVAEPQLYAQLAPDVERLESQQATARTVLVAGVAAGVASAIYAFAGRSNCQEPSLGDPDFGAKLDAWGSCNSNNIDKTAAFTFLAMGAVAAGAVGAYAISPSRSDLLEVVNKNNRLSPEPLRLQLGYEPNRQLAFVGATLTF